MTEQEIEQLLNILKIDVVNEENLQLEKFSQVVLDNFNMLTGHNDTRCYRCVTNAIPGFYEDIFNPAYITCVSDLAGENLPEKVSVYYKKTTRVESVFECLSSQIMAYMGAPTCFNFITQGEIMNDMLEITKVLKTVSVDFISYGERFYSFSDLLFNFSIHSVVGNPMPVKEIIDSIPNAILDNFPKRRNVDYSSQIKKLQEDFIKTWLVRRVLLGDFDFNQVNCGILHNGKNNTFRFVNFDYELCGQRVNRSRLMEEHVSTCAKFCPEFYNEYIEKLKKLKSVELLALRDASGAQYNFLNGVFRNASSILDYHERYIADFPEV